MKNPEQKMRFTDPELSLMKSLFAENTELLYILRKVMLQFGITEAEDVTLRKAMTDQAYALVCKTLLPQIDAEAPLFQLTDMHVSLQADIRAGVEQAWPFILAKELEIEYITQQLKAVKDTSSPQPIKLAQMTKVKGKKEDVWVNLTAWSFILSYVDSNIQQVKFLAGLKEETVEETKERLSKDSNK